MSSSNTESLTKAMDDWVAAINSGDFETALDVMGDDAAVISPDGSVDIGRAAITLKISELTQIPGFVLQYTHANVAISDDGRIGFVSGPSEITFTTPEGTQATTKQTLLTVWRRTQTQTWSCFLDVVMPPLSA